MRDAVPSGAFTWRASCILAWALALLWPCRIGFGWGHEGHTVVALIAEKCAFEQQTTSVVFKNTYGPSHNVEPLFRRGVWAMV